MNNSLNLEIISPGKNVYSGNVTSVSAPGVLGEFQVLFNHAALVSNLEVGIIKIVDDKQFEINYSISGGILEIRKNNVNILVETIESKEEIDVERAKKSIERANDRIAAHEKGFDRERALFSIRRAKNRLKLAGEKIVTK